MTKENCSNFFRRNVKAIIKEMGMTQKEFAERIGISYREWNNRMARDRVIDLVFAIKVADEVGEYVEDLCKGIL